MKSNNVLPSSLNMGPGTDRLAAFYLFLFFVTVYLLTASWLNAYWGDVSQLRMAVTKSLVEKFDLTVPVGIRGSDGRQYSWFGIGSSLLSVPFYSLAKATGISPGIAVSTENQLAGAGTVALLFVFCACLGYSRRASLLVSFCYGLGTVAWFMSKDAGDHAIETLFVLLSVFAMYRYLVSRKTLLLTLSAFALGIAFLTRMTSILVAPSLLILYIFFHYGKTPSREVIRLLARDVLVFSLVFIPFLCLDLWYNYYRFGSVFESGYSLMASRLGINFFSGTPLLTGIEGFLVSPGKGFFYYSPVTIFFFFSVRKFSRKHMALTISFICIAVSYLLFFSKNIYWHGDTTWGPRYLFVLTPLLMIPAAEIFDSGLWQNKSRRGILAAIFFVSMFIQIASVSVHPYRYFNYLRFEKKVHFSVAGGKGVWSIVEPPAGLYFNWAESPIPYQFMFLYDAAREECSYRYTPPAADARPADKIKAMPFMHVPDFWWAYEYAMNRSVAGMEAACLLLFASLYIFARLWRFMFRSADNMEAPENIRA
jgi:Dolichyl-phosphate-mannose-protein mannosyltransferase